MSGQPPASGPPSFGPPAAGQDRKPDAVAEDWHGWHRMHPITPFIKGWKAITAVFVIVTGQNYQYLVNLSQTEATVRKFGGWGVVLGLFAAAILVVLVACFLSWRVARYRVEDKAVHLVGGIIFRQRRQARLDRLQAVDVAQPLLARIFGLAKLTLQVAGGSDSSIDIAYLREPEALALRADLLARAAGLAAAATPAPGLSASDDARPHGIAPAAEDGAPGRAWTPSSPATSIDPAQRLGLPATSDQMATPPGGSPVDPDGASAPGTPRPVGQPPTAPAGTPGGVHFAEASERPVFQVPLPRLAASMLMTSMPLWLLAAIAAVVITAITTRELSAILGVAPLLFGVGAVAWTRFNRECGFRAAISADGIRLVHGLTELRRQTVPPGRVQALRVSQPLLWRLTGWWRVEMNVAGYGVTEDGEGADSVLLPVGSGEQVAQALWLVFADSADQVDPGLLEVAMTGSGPAEGLVCAPTSARWLSPIGWKRRAAVLAPGAVLLRRGWVVRTLFIVPYARIQSLAINQGPLQRALQVGGLAVHSTPGPVTARLDHLGADQVAELIDRLTVAARKARISARPEQWMSKRSE